MPPTLLRLGTTALLALHAVPAHAARTQTALPPTEVMTYRTVGDVTLHLEVFAPSGPKNTAPRAAVVFFFGGGWTGGTTAMFHPFAARLAERGLVALCAEYRIRDRHGTDPFAAVADARAALRWVRPITPASASIRAASPPAAAPPADISPLPAPCCPASTIPPTISR